MLETMQNYELVAEEKLKNVNIQGRQKQIINWQIFYLVRCKCKQNQLGCSKKMHDTRENCLASKLKRD